MGPQTFYNQGVRRNAADTSLKQQSDYTTNAYDAYAQMLTTKEQQAKADALPVGGTGLAKLETAISNSPQLQSGLLAAGLSLMFGGDAETAVTAGVGAAANVNLQDKQAEESKKAEFLGSAKQQSQMEHSYSQADLFGRQPDDFGLQAARLQVGAGQDRAAMDWLKMRGDWITSLTEPKVDSMGNVTPGMSLAEATNVVDNKYFRDPVRMFTLNPGPSVGTPGANLPDYRKFIATPTGLAQLNSAKAFAKTPAWKAMTPEEKVSYANAFLSQTGLTNVTYAHELVADMDAAGGSTKPGKAGKGGAAGAPAAKRDLGPPRPFFDPTIDPRVHNRQFRVEANQSQVQRMHDALRPENFNRNK